MTILKLFLVVFCFVLVCLFFSRVLPKEHGVPEVAWRGQADQLWDLPWGHWWHPGPPKNDKAESQNHRIVGVGGNLKRSWGPNP